MRTVLDGFCEHVVGSCIRHVLIDEVDAAKCVVHLRKVSVEGIISSPSKLGLCVQLDIRVMRKVPYTRMTVGSIVLEEFFYYGFVSMSCVQSLF